MFNRILYYFFVIGIGLAVFSQSLKVHAKQTSKPQTRTAKPKLYFRIAPTPEVKPDEFSATLIVSQITATFRLPKSGLAGDVFPVQYDLSGRGLAAVEATAFENPDYLNRWVYTTSAFPKELRIIFNYLGAVPTNKSGEYAKKLIPKLSNRFSVNRYYRILFEVRNFGKTMLKSQGYGKITYSLKIVSVTTANTKIAVIEKFSPKVDFDLYPGEKQVISYLIKPLPPGMYLIKMVAILNDTQLIAETDLPITVVTENNPDPGVVVPESIPLQAPEMFPSTVKEWQEPLHSFRIHELREPEWRAISGVLFLPMPDRSKIRGSFEDCSVILRLVTPSGLSTATVKVTLEKHKKKGRKIKSEIQNSNPEGSG
jgi:hypothetical protein